MQRGATNGIQYAVQNIGPLTPGAYYSFSAWFKTTPSQAAAMEFYDQGWEDSSGVVVGEEFPAASMFGSGDWANITQTIMIPTVDDYGQSTATHNWWIFLYNYQMSSTAVPNLDPIDYDAVSVVQLASNPWAPTAFGCVSNAHSKFIDFGATNESSSDISFSPTNALSATNLDGDGVTTYRSLLPMQSVTLTIPAFDVDANGLPTNSMLLEIRFKDTIDQTLYEMSSVATRHRALVASFINFGNGDPLNGTPNTSASDYLAGTWRTLSPLGDSLGVAADWQWKLSQFVFQKDYFQLIRAISNSFTFQITMPQLGTYDTTNSLPLDYITLCSITDAQYTNLIQQQRDQHQFRRLPTPADVPTNAVTYANSNLIVFTRDLMRPIYSLTRPQTNEIGQTVSSFSALGETEVLTCGLYSQLGATGLTFSVSALTNGGSAISQTNISINLVLYNDKRTSYRPDSDWPNKSYISAPDMLIQTNACDLAAGTAQRVWLKVAIPTNTAAGSYQGELDITQAGTTIKRVTLQLQVLPFVLDSPPCAYPIIYGDPYIRPLCQDNSKVFNLYREIGLDPFFDPLGGLNVTTNAGVVAFDTSHLASQFQYEMAQGYFKGTAVFETIYIASGIYCGLYGGTTTVGDVNLWDRLSQPEYSNRLYTVISQIVSLAPNRTFIFQCGDEPKADPYTRIMSDRNFTLLRSWGYDTTCPYNAICDSPAASAPYVTPTGYIPPLTSLCDYKMWYLTDQGTNTANFNYALTCFNQMRMPVYNRFVDGLFAVKANAKLAGQYSMSLCYGNPFDDCDPDYSFIFPADAYDYAIVYPTWTSNLLSTMASEGIREGIKDAKYVATLERLIGQHPGTAATAAQTYLNTVMARVNPSYASYYGRETAYGYFNQIVSVVSDTGSPNDYEAFTRIRKSVADFIVQLASPLAPASDLKRL